MSQLVEAALDVLSQALGGGIGVFVRLAVGTGALSNRAAGLFARGWRGRRSEEAIEDAASSRRRSRSAAT